MVFISSVLVIICCRVLGACFAVESAAVKVDLLKNLDSRTTKDVMLFIKGTESNFQSTLDQALPAVGGNIGSRVKQIKRSRYKLRAPGKSKGVLREDNGNKDADTENATVAPPSPATTEQGVINNRTATNTAVLADAESKVDIKLQGWQYALIAICMATFLMFLGGICSATVVLCRLLKETEEEQLQQTRSCECT